MFRLPLREARRLLNYAPFYSRWGKAVPLCKDCAYCMTDKQQILDYFKDHPYFKNFRHRPADRRCMVGAFAVEPEARCSHAKPRL